jgi:hypothetical protein
VGNKQQYKHQNQNKNFTSITHQLSSFLAVEYLPPTRTLLLFYGEGREREIGSPHDSLVSRAV